MFSGRVSGIEAMENALPALPVRIALPSYPIPANYGENTLERVLAETLPESPIVRQALYAVAAASAETRGTDARRGPDLNIDGRIGMTDSGGREEIRRDSLGGFQGSFTIFDNGAGALRTDRSRWLVAAAVASLRERIEAVCFNVIEAAMSYERATALLLLADEQVRTFERLVTAVRTQVRAGVSPVSEVPEAETRLERVRTSRVQIMATKEDAATRMRRVTGKEILPSTQHIRLPEQMESPEAMAETHPSTLALDAEVRAAIRAALAVDAERLGSLTFQFGPSGFMQMFGGQGVWALGSAFVRLNLPLLDGGERSSRLRQSVAQLEITLARRRDSALAVAAGIRQARTAMEAASETLRLARREEDAARRMVETKTADWRAGVGDLRSVLDAVQSRTDSAIRAEAARHDLRIAHLRLLATAGRLARVFGVGDGEEIDMLSNEPYRVATTLLRENRVTINLDKAR